MFLKICAMCVARERHHIVAVPKDQASAFAYV